MRMTPEQAKKLREIGKLSKRERPHGTWTTLGREMGFDPAYVRRVALGLSQKTRINSGTYKKGVSHNQGTENPSSILTEVEVREIRRLRRQENPPTYPVLADKYRVSPSAVSAAALGYTWKHVPMNE